jgi:hypothetical protein
MDQATEKLASPDTVLARVQDVFRAELDNDDLVIGLDTRQKDLKRSNCSTYAQHGKLYRDHFYKAWSTMSLSRLRGLGQPGAYPAGQRHRIRCSIQSQRD